MADYLGRDVRTAARWEKLGMPVHRISGAKGRAVFAYTDEIDAWIAGDMRDIICPNTQKPCPVLARHRGFDSSVNE